MTDDERASLTSAQRAADEGRLAQWVVDFLSSPGSSNPELAAALAMRGTIYLGPIRIALDRLTPMAGPDGDEVVVPVAKEDWESDIHRMEHSIEEGWHPRLCLCHITMAGTSSRTGITVGRRCAERAPAPPGRSSCSQTRWSEIGS